VVTVGPEVDARDPEAVLGAIASWFEPEEDFLLLPGTAMDTLDFTSFRPNLGSKMILDATRREGRPPRGPIDPGSIPDLRDLHPSILDSRLLAGSLLAVRTRGDGFDDPPPAGLGREVLERLLSSEVAATRPALARVPLLAVVSEDVRLEERTHLLWGVFTRFDAARDVLFRETRLAGSAPVHRGTLGIDATWKPGYPRTVRSDEETRRLVDRRWMEYGLERRAPGTGLSVRRGAAPRGAPPGDAC
jgi:4-hydroxy-3-polyprenylbenzoate decarboxylase